MSWFEEEDAKYSKEDGFVSNKQNERQEEYLKSSIDEMQYYIDRLSDITKVGNLYSCSCCFHDEKTPSLRIFPPGFVNPDGKKQKYSSFYCFGCEKGGDIIKFEQLYEGLDTRREAVTSLMKKYNLQTEEIDEIAQLKLALKEMEEEKEVSNSLSLNDINLICSIMCRNYLLEVKKNYSDKFNNEFKYIQSIYNKLDNKLLELNALDAEKLIDMTKNSINKRKKSLKDLTNTEK